MRSFIQTALLLIPLLLVSALAQDPRSAASPNPGAPDLTWSTEAVGPQRFVAVHGRQAVVMGYAGSGLEVWAYPLQLVSNYQISFISKDQTQAILGTSLLRRIEYRPDEVERVYVGDDFVVHEHIFVPLNQPGAIFTYEFEGRGDIAVRVRFAPSLNLMWPGALGGQSISWSDGISGYVLTEPLYKFSAAIASPDAIAHDAVANRTTQGTEETSLTSLVLHPKALRGEAKVAKLFIGYDSPGIAVGSGIIPALENHEAEFREEKAKHDHDLLTHALSIVTPDPELNRALAWSILALDQAWVCNAALGCGEIAGYGPSRPGRRPQYDWFFAGDGLISVEALLDAGEYDRARKELAFISKYQNKLNGMIWHELSQSAALVSWEKQYPYMYVHVDTTFTYLSTLARYLQVTGDEAFLKAHWNGVQKAFQYCQSLIDPKTKLPSIPPGREGGNEQERMRDDLGLSSSWIAAASGFAQMARAMGSPEAIAAERDAEAARVAVALENWNPQNHFWIDGHTVTGRSMQEGRSGPIAVLSQHVFSPLQVDQILDQLSSPEFQTDWGTRNVSATSPYYDPNSYAGGSVSALGSSEVAIGFWQQHRPITAWQIWQALLAWNRQDSQGHLHEVLAGDYYHPEMESVPEQTWSSAGYLSAAVSGLLGLHVQSAKQQVTFAPHLPASWNDISVGNVRVGASLLQLRVSRDMSGVTLEVENNSEPVSFTFAPEIPLGATLKGATVGTGISVETDIPASVALHTQDEHATTTFRAPRGVSRCRISYQGGVQLMPVASAPLTGAVSRNMEISSITLVGNTLTVNAFVRTNGISTFTLDTAWKPVSVTGGSFVPQASYRYLLEFNVSDRDSVQAGAMPTQKRMVIHF